MLLIRELVNPLLKTPTWLANQTVLHGVLSLTRKVWPIVTNLQKRFALNLLGHIWENKNKQLFAKGEVTIELEANNCFSIIAN